MKGPGTFIKEMGTTRKVGEKGPRSGGLFYKKQHLEADSTETERGRQDPGRQIWRLAYVQVASTRDLNKASGN